MEQHAVMCTVESVRDSFKINFCMGTAVGPKPKVKKNTPKFRRLFLNE